MKTFKDNAGRTWTVEVNIATVKRVRSLINVDLMDVINKDNHENLMNRLALDPILMGNVVYAVCKPDADKINVDDENFGRALAGDVIDHAYMALMEELVDFFPEEKRQVLHKALLKQRKVEKKAAKAARLYIENPKIDEQIDAEIRSIIASYGNSPVSPGSTRTRSR